MLGVDEGTDAARALRLRHDVKRQGSLAGGLRPVDFDDAPARQPTQTESDVEPKGTRGHDGHLGRGDVVAEAHDAAFAKLLFDSGNRQLDGPVAAGVAHARRLACFRFGFLVLASIRTSQIRHCFSQHHIKYRRAMSSA